MPYTVEPIEAPVGTPTAGPKEFDLPVKTFDPRDPKTVQKSVAQNPAPNAQNTNPQQTATTETPAAPATQPANPEESVRLSPKIAAIARKEQQVRAREQELARREKELEARLKDGDQYRSVREKLAKKDFSAVEELGVTYEDHLKYATEKVESADPEKARIQKLEAELQEMRKALQERDSSDYETNQNLWREEIATVIAKNPDFAVIKKLGAESAVLDHINDSFEEDNVKLTAEEAIRDVLAEIKRRKDAYDGAFKIETPPETTPATGKELGPPPKRDVETITQDMTVTSRAQSRKAISQLPEAEQVAEAIRRWEEEKAKRFQR